MNLRAIAACGLVVVVLLGGCSNDRFGEADVLKQIQTSTSCADLRQTSDEATATIAANGGGKEFDQAVGYFNAAEDRMDELGC